jgi:hypothetical protein
MTKAKMRLELAAYAGWTVEKIIAHHGLTKEQGSMFNLDEFVPDYPNDLNACHDFWINNLSCSDGPICSDWIRRILRRDNPSATESELRDQYEQNAAAHQRAEAFCRTIGIWENDSTDVTEL